MTIKSILAATAALMIIAAPAMARDYTVDTAASSVHFSGTHTGKAFTGAFGTWNAAITFDPDDLAASRLSATFDTATAKTGNAMYDGTLPQADWFDSKNHKEATFASTAITQNEDGSYAAAGDLTIRGITKPVTMNFTIDDLTASPVTAKGNLAIDRLDFDMGRKSDEPAEWVGQTITIDLAITATPQ